MNLTAEDVTNLLALIAVAPIRGDQAFTVASLQQKLTLMANGFNAPKDVDEPAPKEVKEAGEKTEEKPQVEKKADKK